MNKLILFTITIILFGCGKNEVRNQIDYPVASSLPTLLATCGPSPTSACADIYYDTVTEALFNHYGACPFDIKDCQAYESDCLDSYDYEDAYKCN